MLFFSFCFVYSCTTTKETLKEEKEMIKEIEPKFSISARTKFFLNDLEEELRYTNSMISDFSPSETLQNNYNLKQICLFLNLNA